MRRFSTLWTTMTKGITINSSYSQFIGIRRIGNTILRIQGDLMKAAAFDYVRAADIDEVCRLLADAGDEGRKIIAGGQTLVPLMAMRMARPNMLIDINDVPGLSGIEDQETYVAIGGCTRQRALERSDVISDRLPLLAKAVRNVGHVQTRNRGTVGGSIVHGDPSWRKYRSLRWLLRRQLFLRSTSGNQHTPRRLFRAAMVTKIEPDQILTEIPGSRMAGAALSVPGSTKPPAVSAIMRSSPQPRKSNLLVMEPS